MATTSSLLSHGDAKAPARVTLHHLRQQAEKPVERPDFCLSDFIAPQEANKQDWLGGFAVTAGIGIEEHVARFETDHDDYSAILLKALADRLAEAFAERMHERVRREFWGLSPNELLDSEALIAEKYSGIRPPPAIPRAPTTRRKPRCSICSTPPTTQASSSPKASRCIPPPRSPDGISRTPNSQYFVVGRITREQVDDYAKRKGWTRQETERWLAPNLDYDPE